MSATILLDTSKVNALFWLFVNEQFSNIHFYFHEYLFFSQKDISAVLQMYSASCGVVLEPFMPSVP